MPLEFDPTSSKILYEGHQVGKYRIENGVAKVTLNISYECRPEEWIVPISWFSYGLNIVKPLSQKIHPSDLVIDSKEEDICQRFDVFRLLTEKTIKQNGYIWRFHKSEADNWPSVLHGHEYDKNLKLDVITGCIYDSATHECCMRLNRKKLTIIQEKLRASPDFCELVEKLLI